MESELLKNLRIWLRALKLNMRGLWLRLFPRETLEKQINWLREQNAELQTFNQMLRNNFLELEADIRKLHEKHLKEKTHHAEVCKRLVQKKNQLIAENENLQTRCSYLIASVQELEREREKWVAKTQAHRDARRQICAVLNKLGQEDSFSEPDPGPKPRYRKPTVEDLMQGPIPVEVSKDGQKWHEFYLVAIDNDSNPYVCQRRNNQGEPHRYFRFARVLDTGTKPDA